MSKQSAQSASSGPAEKHPIRGLWKLSLFSTAFTYFVIFAGGLVRVAGAGLGCPDWPRCFGRWFPPTDVSQLPAGVDPASFNVTLAWIEYSNRLGGVIFGLILVYQSIYVLRHFRHDKQILWTTLLATLFTGVQGWLGGYVVTTDLKPIIVTLHMALALVILSLVIWTLLRARTLLDPSKQLPREKTIALRRWTVGLWIFAIFQLSLGAAVRGALEELVVTHPLATGREALALVGTIKHLHLLCGMLMAAVTGYIWNRALSIDTGKSSPIRIAASSSLHTVGLQILLGFVLMLVGTAAVAQLFHLMLASAFIGAVVFLYGALQPKDS
ncbi:MAG: COX15/CtaA family protein [Candidatus Zixiibacteriota bacterium]